MPSRVTVDQRRRDLIDAAFRVMSDIGIARSTTRAICADAGVHQSVFHYSFSSKKELLQELVRVVVLDMVDPAVLASSVTSEVAPSIHAGFQRLWNQARAYPERQLVVYELTTHVLRVPELAGLAAWQYQHYFKQAKRFAEAIQEAASIEWTLPIHVISRMITTAIDGVILGWLADNDDRAARVPLWSSPNCSRSSSDHVIQCELHPPWRQGDRILG